MYKIVVWLLQQITAEQDGISSAVIRNRCFGVKLIVGKLSLRRPHPAFDLCVSWQQPRNCLFSIDCLLSARMFLFYNNVAYCVEGFVFVKYYYAVGHLFTLCRVLSTRRQRHCEASQHVAPSQAFVCLEHSCTTVQCTEAIIQLLYRIGKATFHKIN